MQTYSCHTILNMILVVTDKSIITEVFMRKPYNLLFFLEWQFLQEMPRQHMYDIVFHLEVDLAILGWKLVHSIFKKYM